MGYKKPIYYQITRFFEGLLFVVGAGTIVVVIVVVIGDIYLKMTGNG